MSRIRITAGSVTLPAELGPGATARRVWEALPIEGKANRWGDEIYFEIPVEADPEPEAREEVEVGALGYWPPGKAFCIFFGRTPVSTGEHPRAASPVNPLGRVIGDATAFRAVRGGTRVRLERAQA